MAQSSREVVRAALRFAGPERLPVRMACCGCDDTRWIPWVAPSGVGKWGECRVDEWGCAWETTDVHNMGQVKGHPLASLAEAEGIVFPDYSGEAVYAGSEAALHAAEAEDKYTQVGIFFVLFERMHALVGFENLLMGLALEPAAAGALADRIVEAQLTLVRGMQERFGTRLHSFSMTDDWGTQQAAFIGMDMWSDLFFPRYKRLFDAMHEGGQDVWVHSCGKVNEIIEGYIRAGVDVVNLQQPRALGISEIGARYRGRITFESLADIQATLPKNDPALIQADAEALAEHWMGKAGGFVFSDYGNGEAIGAPLSAKRAMYEAFSRVSADLYGKPLPTPHWAP